jgi:trimeric autotransporter adhesin
MTSTPCGWAGFRIGLVAAAILAVGGPAAAAAEPAVQVADLVTAGVDGDGLDETPMLAVGETVYFRGRDAAHGTELWRSDGTPETTAMVRDVCPGPCDSSPAELVEVDGTVFFVASDGLTGRELWRSDGTAAGTLLVRDICPGACGAIAAGSGAKPVRVGDRLLFRAADPEAGSELWGSDGTLAGTARLADLCPGPCDGGIYDLAAAGSEALFRARDPGHGIEPWRSDGTAAGTFVLADLCPGPCSSGFERDQDSLFGRTFLRLGDETLVWWLSAHVPSLSACWTLWSSDPAHRVAGKRVLACGFSNLPPPPLVELGGVPYFGFDKALWKVDLAAAERKLVYELWSTPVEIVRMGARLFFAGRKEGGWELWRSDGTAAGTELVVDTAPGEVWGNPSQLTPAGDRLYFTSNAKPGLPVEGKQLWASDGSLTGAKRLHPPSGTLSGMAALTASGNRLFLAAAGSSGGRELWRSDGTTGGTVLVRDLHDDPGSSHPRGLAASDGTIVFSARTRPWPAYPPEAVWRSDGTPAGTSLLGPLGAVVTPTSFGGSLLFSAQAVTWPYFSLFATDGTATGTRAIGPGATATQELGARLFFAGSGAEGVELWVTDGTAAGSRLVKDIRPGFEEQLDTYGLPPYPRSSSPYGFVPLGSVVLFVAADDEHGEELWRSDGTPAGTTLVADLCPGPCSPRIAETTGFGGRVFFVADGPGASGRELWTSDGTAAGTRPAIDLLPGAASSNPRDLAVFAGRLLLFADDAAGRERLFASDGAVTGA